MPCCECCTKKRTAQIFLVLGAALLIASFVIAAALVQIVASALRENAVFPTPNSSRYNDALSNIPSQQKNGDAASTYYSFYFFNITNLDAVVLNKTTAMVDEVGPYIYRSFTTKIDVSFNSDYSRVKYRPWTYRVFQADQSAPLNDLTDTIITVDPLYHTVYGWDGSSLDGVPEVASRITVAASAFSTLAVKIFRVLTVQQDGAAGSLPYYTADDNSRFAQLFVANLNLISYKGQAYTGIAPLITSLLRNVSNVPRFTVDMPAVEYRTVVTAVDPSLAASSGFAAVFTPDTASPINPSGSATALSIASSLKCTDMSLANTTAPTTFTCWSLLPQFMANAGVPWTNIWPAMASLVGTGTNITGNQALGIYTWVHVLAGSAPLLYVPAAAAAFPALANAYGSQAKVSAASVFEWAAQRMGHQGINYATGTGTRVTSATGYPTYPVPLAGAGSPLNAFATTKWNNANMYISRPPRSLAYENANILFGLFPLGRSDDMVSSPFTNYSNQAYAQLYDQFEIDGTGQLNITDVDNIYMFNSYEKLSTGIAKAGKSNFCKNPSTDGYPVQFGFTKATPKYAPGGIGTNPFTMSKSVVDKGLTIDVWSSDISRHIRLGYIGEAKVEGIDVLRYNFSYMELPAVPALNQPYFGVISTYCYQGDNLLTLPHLQAAGVFVDYAGAGTSMSSLGLANEVTVKYLSNEYLASKNVPPTGDLADIQPFLDLEPYSGQLVRGSLREQISVYYRNPTGDGVGTSAALGGAFNFAYDMSPARYTVFPSMWINRYGQLSTKQADTIKAGVYGALTASLVILIIGSILGGVSFIVSFALLVVYTKQDPNSTPYASQSSRADLTA